MNMIQVPDISRKLVTRYGLREKSPTPTLSAEVVPVVLVDDLIGESDLIRPRIRPCVGQIEFVPAAQQPVMGLVNPVGSRVIAHMLYFIIGGSVAGYWDVHLTGTPNSNFPGANAFRNGLLGGLGQSPACGVFGQVNPASPGGAIAGKIRNPGASQQVIVPWDAVIDEGQGTQLRSNAAISGVCAMTVFWTEEDKN